MMFALALAGCGGAKQVRLSIRPEADMNEVRSCYVVVRAVDDAVFATEGYKDVAAKAMSPDSTVQSVVVTVPGVSQEIEVPAPGKGRLAVYAMLRRPDGSAWRLLLPTSVPEHVEIRIGRTQVCWARTSAPRSTTGEPSRTATGECARWSTAR
jgi:hypothetical protein